jgi:7-carboxy-7-deazaguanine synthase
MTLTLPPLKEITNPLDVEVGINEIFYSIQGEGLHTGEPTLFIRFQFCPWSCTWCDSRRTWAKADEKLTVREVIAQAKEIGEGTSRILITGGEPLSQPVAFRALVKELAWWAKPIDVETSGLNPLPRGYSPFNDIASWVWDVKCPSSEMDQWNKLDQLRRLRTQDQIKFVVADSRDLEYVTEVQSEYYPISAHTIISPLFEYEDSDGSQIPARSSQAWLQEVADYCKNSGFRMGLQIHKLIWGDIAGV